MKELFEKEKLFWVVATILIVFIVGLAGYFLYHQHITATTQNGGTGSSSGVTSSGKYPEKTQVKDTADPNVKEVTTSKNDTLQVKTETGETVTVPSYIPPVNK